MNKGLFGFRFNGLRHNAVRLAQISALALTVMLAIPASAANDRAVKSRVAPIYPEIAKRLKIAGVVHLEVTVDPEGKVTEVKPVSGNQMLSPAAADAVRKWRFTSGSGDTTVDVEVNFAL